MKNEMDDLNKLELKSCSSGSDGMKMEVDKSKKGSGSGVKQYSDNSKSRKSSNSKKSEISSNNKLLQRGGSYHNLFK